MTKAMSAPEASVFVSYSRKDAAFVEELRISLETYGFDVLFDQEDIAHGEPWEPRLHSLIKQADTTVCVISSAWVASIECVKELDIALSLGRRVIPVIREPIDPAKIPAPLARLQFVFFHGEKHTYARGVANLIMALSDDIAWVREQSRFLALATDWASLQKSNAMLLRGDALQLAQKWFSSKTPDNAHVLRLVAEFIEASESNQIADERKKLRGRIWQISLAALAVVALLGCGLAFSLVTTKTAEVNEKAAKLEAQKADIAAFKLAANETSNCTSSCDPNSAQEAAAPSGSASEQSDRTSAPLAESNIASFIDDLNSDSRNARLRAGQEVARLIKSANHDVTLKLLVRQLQQPQLDKLSASGRFNVLYMLNLSDGPSLKRAIEADLSEAIKIINARSETGMMIGDQTRDCMQSLSDKLGGALGKQSCG